MTIRTSSVHAVSAGALLFLAVATFLPSLLRAEPTAVLLGPAPGGAGMGATVTLTARVEVPASREPGAPEPGLFELELQGRERPAAAGFVVAVLPDTQFYSESYPDIFVAQTTWLVANSPLPIVFVTHLGDVVDVASDAAQWVNADAALSLLDGVLPYGLAVGNHDVPSTLFNQTFPVERYAAEPWYGGHYGDTNDSSYQLISASGVGLLFLHLTWCPTADVLAWGAEVLAAHPDRVAFVTTHGYLDTAGRRGVALCPDTQPLWDQLIAPSPNVHVVLCGHVFGAAYRVDRVGERAVHQLLFDTQYEANGGNGWLRLLRVEPADDVIHVETYSPWLGLNRTDAKNAFTLDVPLLGGWQRLGGRRDVPPGQVVAVPWSGREGGSTYQWRAVATTADGARTVAPFREFSTRPAVSVAGLALNLQSAGAYRFATARVQLAPALANAKIIGEWRLDGALLKANAAATTGPTGQATLASPARKASPGQVFSFHVTGLTRSGYLYAPSANALSEGSVTVPGGGP